MRVAKINTIPYTKCYVGCKVDGQTIVHVRYERRQTSGFQQQTLAYMTTQSDKVITREVDFTG